jgi:hypothetical protein
MVINAETGESFSVGDTKEGKYTVHIRDEHGEVNTKYSYLLIIHYHLDSEKKEVIRLFCSTKLKEKNNTDLPH